MEKKKLQVITLASLMTVVVGVLLYQFLNTPRSSVPGQEAEVPEGDYEEQLLRAEMMVKNIEEHRDTVSEMEKELEEYTGEIPLNSDHTWFSRQINKITREIGLNDVSQKFRQAGSSGFKLDAGMQKKYVEKMWEIRMRCDYHDLGRFLSRLEDSHRLLEVADITIEGNEPKGQEIVLLIRYLVRTNGSSGD